MEVFLGRPKKVSYTENKTDKKGREEEDKKTKRWIKDGNKNSSRWSNRNKYIDISLNKKKIFLLK